MHYFLNLELLIQQPSSSSSSFFIPFNAGQVFTKTLLGNTNLD